MMLAWLRRAFHKPPRAKRRYDGPYKAFTKEHDQEVSFRDDPGFAKRLPIAWMYPRPDAADYLDRCVTLYEKIAERMVADIAQIPRGDTAVTLLLDHSGSLRGEVSCRLAAVAGVYSECLARLDVRHEVLGFTTSSWRGGRSFIDWKARGAPEQPGRLCDLLHIVYHAFDDDGPVAYEALEQMTDPYLLKENIDGEALEWAARRLRARHAARRVLIIVSDGAPVDDATLAANGPNILEDHVRLVSSMIIASGDIELYAIGLGHGMGRYHPQFAVINTDEDIGAIALPVLGAIIGSGAHAPSKAQAQLPP